MFAEADAGAGTFAQRRERLHVEYAHGKEHAVARFDRARAHELHGAVPDTAPSVAKRMVVALDLSTHSPVVTCDMRESVSDDPHPLTRSAVPAASAAREIGRANRRITSGSSGVAVPRMLTGPV